MSGVGHSKKAFSREGTCRAVSWLLVIMSCSVSCTHEHRQLRQQLGGRNIKKRRPAIHGLRESKETSSVRWRNCSERDFHRSTPLHTDAHSQNRACQHEDGRLRNSQSIATSTNEKGGSKNTKECAHGSRRNEELQAGRGSRSSHRAESRAESSEESRAESGKQRCVRLELQVEAAEDVQVFVQLEHQVAHRLAPHRPAGMVWIEQTAN